MKRPRLVALARAAVTVALIGLIVLWIEPGRVWETLREAALGPLMLGLLLTPAVILIKALRWWILGRSAALLTFRRALASYLAGLALATVTPAAVGEAGRALFVPQADHVTLTGRVVLDKIVDLGSLTVLAAIGLAVSDRPLGRTVGMALLGVTLAGGAVAVFGMPLLQRAIGRLLGHRVPRWIQSLMGGLLETPRAHLLANIALAFVGLSVFYTQAAVVMRAFWPEVPLTALQVFPLITLSTLLPVSIGGLGVREWAAVTLLHGPGIPEAVAFNTFFVHYLLVNVPPAAVGAFVIGSARHDRATGQPPHEEIGGTQTLS